MVEIETLKYALKAFANLDHEDFKFSSQFWHVKSYKKGEYYNEYKAVCRYLGFITDGVFRSYIIDEKTGEEKNIFLYTPHGFVVTFKSFINQITCDYHINSRINGNVLAGS
jgi:signal-transduction protein with cAMP-binding, CBS, and nucleotidyltransferase domain